QSIVRSHHTTRHAAVWQIRAAILYTGDHACPIDGKSNLDATFEVGIAREALLVTHTEAPIILAHDALNHLGRQASADHSRTDPHLPRHLGLVPATESS